MASLDRAIEGPTSAVKTGTSTIAGMRGAPSNLANSLKSNS